MSAGGPGRTLAGLAVLLVGVVTGWLAPPGAPSPATLERGSPPPAIPVVLVPGTTGSALAARATGELAWGRTGNLLAPRDGGYALALPITEPLGDPATAADEVPSRLEATAVLGTLRLGPARKPIYDPLLDALAAAGYRRGDLARPEPGDTLFAFPYDWRQSNVVGARRLLAALAHLRQARGGDAVQVDLICQSSGAHICRWLIRHGGASIAAAEAGAQPPAWLRVRKLVLVGAPNGGSLRILREIDRGRRYVPLAGRRMRPEVLFSFRSLYEDLPHAGEGLLLDEDGEPLPAGEGDLYRAETWRRLGWSVFAPGARERLLARRDLFFAGEDERFAYLAERLEAARRVHTLLARDPETSRVPRIYLVGNDDEPTPRRAGGRRLPPLRVGDPLHRRPRSAPPPQGGRARRPCGRPRRRPHDPRKPPRLGPRRAHRRRRPALPRPRRPLRDDRPPGDPLLDRRAPARAGRALSAPFPLETSRLQEAALHLCSSTA